MSRFQIVLEPIDSPREEVRALSIRVGDVVLTRVLRHGASQEDDAIRVVPARLAWWMLDHWWRLRWEALGPTVTSDWRMAHEVAAAGGGCAWPRLTIWSDGETIRLVQRADPPGVVGPIRFLENALLGVPALAFERGVDDFIAAVSDEAAGMTGDWRAMAELVASLGEERADPELARWRRLEAQLGYDPDEAPEPLLELLVQAASAYGVSGVGEAILASPGPTAGEVLRQELEAAHSGVPCDLLPAARSVGDAVHAPDEEPWQSAERAATAVRQVHDVHGPLTNSRLAEVLGVPRRALAALPQKPFGLAFGLRLRQGSGGQQRVALQSRSGRGRRFELARALGDMVWAGEDGIGPITRTATARQRFQRAFAQSLLCPFGELAQYLGLGGSRGIQIGEEEVQEAARHFQVAESVVWTVLVNKNVTPRDVLLTRRSLLDPSDAQDLGVLSA